ncbi:hypothetical protein SARC_08169 [Sphaeroforma arctica JP610]|uniref:PUM-HD domain-containing protein n=1 Tax=Sphaeroforma arctica JP610 TaxID=667725 RepID=A0A0L0FU35_9EUKA|nr:hypothetical protein SARC_08169 [Sphaeroforma arctica JP610]KNC79438.1 hypothetical protein SARC_08169 [Sphaeroforma arctica JP610]|eukprot:XP_014153340.1 hypothetical protein SARC_08169 [Sphaeroforma arctica JP610]
MSKFQSDKKKGNGAPGAVQKKAYGAKKPSTYLPREERPVRKNSTPNETQEKAELKTKKELKKERQLARPHGDMMFQARQLWEKVRDTSNKDKEARRENVGKLVKLLEGKMADVIFRHDAARIIQAMVQFGTVEQRAVIYGELKGHLLNLMNNTYAKFLVNKMLDYGTPAQREDIIKAMYGNVRKLVKHPDGSDVLEHAFLEKANAAQRNALIQEFYSPEYALFKDTEIKSLAELIAKHSDKKEPVTKSMLDLILSCVNKGVVQPNIVHRAIKEYFEVVDVAEKQVLSTALAEHIVAMLHTRDGSLVAMETIWNCGAKDRKTIVKAFKKHVVQVAMEEYGHLALLALFDSMDDTVLMKKSILNEINDELLTVCQNKFGRLVMIYLLHPRNKRYLMPALQTRLELGDINVYSKKDRVQRQNELRYAVHDPLLKAIAGQTFDYLETGKICQVVEEALSASDVSNENRANAIKAILAAVVEDQTFFNNNESGFLFKRLVQNGTMISDEESFAQGIWDSVKENIEAHSKTTQGCYNLTTLLTCKSLTLEQRKSIGEDIHNKLASLDALSKPDAKNEHGKLTPQAVLAKALKAVQTEQEGDNDSDESDVVAVDSASMAQLNTVEDVEAELKAGAQKKRKLEEALEKQEGEKAAGSAKNSKKSSKKSKKN